MARRAAGDKQETPEEVLARINRNKVMATKRGLSDLVTEDIEEFVFAAEKELATRDPESDEEADTLHISDIIDEIEEESKTRGKVAGISSGYPALDAMIGGFKKSEVTLVAGESNNGKSMVIANIAAMIGMKHRVLYITLEMQPRKVGDRMKYALGGGSRYKSLDILFQKTFTIDYRSLRPLFKNAVDAGAEIVVLDYLQYLGVGMDNKEVGVMSRVCVGLSKEFDIPFVIVVSLRKSDGQRKWTSITKEDIMGTGAIGYDADNIVLISRQNKECEYDDDGVWIKHLKARDMYIDYNNPYLRLKWGSGRIEQDQEWFETEFSDSYKKALIPQKPKDESLAKFMLGGEEVVDQKLWDSIPF